MPPEISAFVTVLRTIDAWHALLFMFFIVFITVMLRVSKSMVRHHRAKMDESIISYKDPDNLPDLRKTLWKTRLQIILCAFSIIVFTSVAIFNSF